MTKEMLLLIIAALGGEDKIGRVIFADNKDYTFGPGEKSILKLDHENSIAYVIQNRINASNDMGMRGLNIYAFPYLQIISVISSEDVARGAIETAIDNLHTRIPLTEEDKAKLLNK